MPDGMLDARVVISGVEVQRFVRAPDGPIMRRMMVVAEGVRQETLHQLDQASSTFPRDFLGPTLVKRTAMTDQGPRIVVGSAHTRTPPHVINGNPLLHFYWEKMGRQMTVHSVNHPGSNFSPYLLRLLLRSLELVRRI